MMNRSTTTLFLFIWMFSGLYHVSAQSSQPFFVEDFPSQSSFNANWTSGGTNQGNQVWQWTDEPIIFGSQPAFNSETVDNGFVIFNSDANGEGNTHDVTLTINNPIDCSNRDQVFISVQNQYEYFSLGGGSVAQLGVSTDGINFDYLEILEEIPANDLTEDVQPILEDISQFAANQPQVFIQFRWQGTYEYAWSIDDIKIYDENPTFQFDVAIFNPRLAPNFATPVSQTGNFFFGHAYRNNGQDNATNLTSTITIESTNADTFSYTTELSPEYAPGSADTTFFDNTPFNPSDTGVYTYTYTLSFDNLDEQPTDNSFSEQFLISEDLFSKDDGRSPRATQPGEIQDNTWEAANYYFIPNGGYQATEAIFSVASENNEHQGQTVSVLLYQVTQDADMDFDDDDLTPVGFGSYTFTDEENGDLVVADLLNFEGDSAIVLNEGAEYLLSVQYTPEMAMVYTPLEYFYDISTLVKNGRWFTGGFGEEFTAVIRMRIEEVNSVNTQEPILAEGQISLFPNPVDQALTIDLALDTRSDEVLIEVFDINGRLMTQRQIDQVKRERLRISTESWSNGTYLLRARTSEGVRTERFVVQHR